MSTFALSSPSSSSPEADTLDSLGSSSAARIAETPGSDENTLAIDGTPEDSMSDIWKLDAEVLSSLSLDGLLEQPPNLFCTAKSSSIIDEFGLYGQGDSVIGTTQTSYSVENGTNADFRSLQSSSSNTPRANSSVDIDMVTEERPGLLVDLTALLAEMSPYETRLSKLSGGDLHSYPVGDALFFTHRFSAILIDYSHGPPPDTNSQLSTPTMLLALSCFMTLTRIHSFIFEHLHEQLSWILESHPTQGLGSCTSQPLGASIQSYRGLRLGQLQPICLCAGWDPAKKAVSMLLSSLGDAEGSLGLPVDVRIIAISGADIQGEQTTSVKAKAVLFEEGSMAALTNGRLYKTMGKQAKELRRKIEEVEELVRGVIDIA